MTRIIGIDFSGAKDAGRRIWVAKGKSTRSDTFRLESCVAAVDLDQGGRDPRTAVGALASEICLNSNTIAGCDFPFGLPRQLVTAENWEGFVRHFAKRYADPLAFRTMIARDTSGVEHKRQTDIHAKTPFNSYNLRLFRQTWWGIVELLRPLVNSESITVRPQQNWRLSRPTVIEVCAACTLKHAGIYKQFSSYKGKGDAPRLQREQIVDYLLSEKLLSFATRKESLLRETLLDNKGGDALDAVIGAIASIHADTKVEPDAYQRLEGRVYFEIG